MLGSLTLLFVLSCLHLHLRTGTRSIEHIVAFLDFSRFCQQIDSCFVVFLWTLISHAASPIKHLHHAVFILLRCKKSLLAFFSVYFLLRCPINLNGRLQKYLCSMRFFQWRLTRLLNTALLHQFLGLWTYCSLKCPNNSIY